MQTHQPISRDPDDQSSFVGAKKLIALALLASLVIIAADVAWLWMTTGNEHPRLAVACFAGITCRRIISMVVYDYIVMEARANPDFRAQE